MLNSRNIVIAGAAGQGVESAVALAGKSLLKAGFHIFITADYQSRVRGGHNFMRIRFGDQPLAAGVWARDMAGVANADDNQNGEKDDS